MLQQEYLRFLQTLKAPGVSVAVRKIANLVLENLDTIQPLSTHQGQRVKKVVKLAQAQWQQLREDIYAEANSVDGNHASFKKLVSLQVGPFRGFARPEIFDLNAPMVLIYGPNGTGKTSFCEALEFGLLGNVIEAESKRIRTQDYLKNAFVNHYEPPVLEAVDSQGQIIPVIPNEAQNRFCFVEKNRIDNFSRIAAQMPARQSELISTLFGLDSFTEFVRNFTPEIDGRYIDRVGIKNQQLLQKKQSLAAAHQQIKDNTEALIVLGQQEAALANQYKPGIAFSELLESLGTPEKPGEIAALEAEVQQQLATKSGFTVTYLQSQSQTIQNHQGNLSAKEQELADSSTALSFKQLYSAVAALENVNRDECPACKTSISRVNINPFELAHQELLKLAHLSQLEQDRDLFRSALSDAIRSVFQVLKAACERFTNNPLQPFLLQHESQVDIAWWNSMLSVGNDGFTAWQHLLAQVQQLEQIDADLEQAHQLRFHKQTRLKWLREIELQSTILKTQRTTLTEGLERARAAIATFNETNANLITESEAEKPIIDRNQEISSAYAAFVIRLTRYKDNLPGKLIADLGERVVQLYNDFNRNDPPNDLLASIKLPLAQGQCIEVAFQGEPQRWFDALHVLSEGHIRCLGLAILIAKNIKENCPLLVFDDPVNAIDDEHRQAIRETLFVDNYLDGKQLIVAIHGEEFFNRTHQLIGKEAASKAESYVFLPRHGEHHIQVNSLRRPKNYVLAARELYSTGEYRDSLMSARRGLESLCEKAWYHYGKHSDKSDSPISVARRAPNQPWDLRSLADNLRIKFSRSKAEIPNKKKMIDSLSSVLGPDAKQPPWTYLNKGTHDETDLPEFDQQTVNQIVTALEDLDAVLSEG